MSFSQGKEASKFRFSTKKRGNLYVPVLKKFKLKEADDAISQVSKTNSPVMSFRISLQILSLCANEERFTSIFYTRPLVQCLVTFEANCKCIFFLTFIRNLVSQHMLTELLHDRQRSHCVITECS